MAWYNSDYFVSAHSIVYSSAHVLFVVFFILESGKIWNLLDSTVDGDENLMAFFFDELLVAVDEKEDLVG